MQGPRRKIIGGNWKMNTTLPGAIDLARGIASRLTDIKGIDVVVFPPFPNLRPVRHALQRSEIALGAQDVFWESRGAFTGEVSAPMLRAVGCRWVIAGHSERRRILGESNDVVNRKLLAALHASLRVILAIGETHEERHGHLE
ncbi:MAG: triose-phosphate isomerase family protein, partial [Chloroflexota bacterium]